MRAIKDSMSELATFQPFVSLAQFRVLGTERSEIRRHM